MFKKIAVSAVVSASLLFGLSSQQIEAAHVQRAEHHSTAHTFKINLSRSGNTWKKQFKNCYNWFLNNQENNDQASGDQVIEDQESTDKEDQLQTPVQDVEEENNETSTDTTIDSTETPESEVTTEETPSDPEQSTDETTEQVDSNLNAFERQVIELTNQERTAQGLEPLTTDESLSAVAREKSNDMYTNGYFSHNSPTYGSPFDMMQQFGVSYRTAGENIAKGQRSPEEVVNAWMNSEGHRANILNPDFTHIGVGYVENGNHWTQMFLGQ